MIFLAPFISLLERFFKTDMRYALRGGFYLTLSQVTSAIAALGLTVAFANLLPIETYGTYRYILAVYGVLAMTALPGIDIAVVQSVSRGHDSAFKEGIRTKLRWSVLGTIVSFIYAAYNYTQGSFTLGHIFILVGVALPLMESFSLYASFLNAKKMFRTWTTVDMAIQAASIASLVGVMLFSKNILALLTAYFIPNIVLRMLVTNYVRRKYVREAVDDPELQRYGRSMTILQVISRFMSSADQIVLYHFLGPAQVAIYTLALAVPSRIQSLFRGTGTLALPKYAARTRADIVASLPRKMLLFAVGITVICVIYVLLAPYLFGLVFPKYLPALPYSQVAIFFTVSAIMYPFSSYLLAHKKVKENYIISIVSFVTKVGCLVVLVPLYGIWGAIIGLLTTSAVTIIVSLWFILYQQGTEVSSNETSQNGAGNIL